MTAMPAPARDGDARAQAQTQSDPALAQTRDSSAFAQAQTLGEAESIWFKLSILAKQDQPIQNLVRMSEKYGGCIKINLRDERIFFLTDIDHFRQVLVTKMDRYGKYFDGLSPIFGKSMITRDGEEWKTIRHTQREAFMPKMFTEYMPYLMASVQDKSREFERLAETGERINLLEHTWGLAASMICKALFNRDLPFNPEIVFRAVKTYTDLGQHRDIRLKKVTGELTEVPLEEAAADAINTWLSVPPAVLGAVPRDIRERTLLDILLAAQANGELPEFDAQQVIDEMKQYLWAGTETTALTLAWCFYLLHLYPDVADRIRAEGEAAYGDRVPTWNEVNSLTYTRAVIQETMRLFPPIWSFIRVATAEDELAGHQIRPGDKIVMCAYVVHHSPRYWEDPEKFDPSRFFPEAEAQRQPLTYLPFSAGKRVCIGGALSLVENSLALTQFLRKFRLEYVGQVPAGISATVTLTPANGDLPFIVHRR
jgi:cytochrome P450